GAGVWPMPDDAFARMVESREPFWTSVARGDDTFRVFLQNDRVGVYALGYPIITATGHFTNLAELVLLTAVGYVCLLTLATLFGSQTLSTRTPSDVYRAIVLDRLPAFVGEETIGSASYGVAAAPVHAGSREAIVTVPLTNRQQDIEQQIDELDRLVVSGAVLFCLLGAALGYWMAERIADPVSRLTRATRRIARGDLDARIAATSSDELRRLAEDFNQTAA